MDADEEMVLWMEHNMEELTDQFIEQNAKDWLEFLDEEYTHYCAGKSDHLYEQVKDAKIFSDR